VARWKDKYLKLQEELTDQYKSDSASKTAELSLHAAERALEEQRVELDGLAKRSGALQGTLEEREHDVKLLKSELDRVRAMLETSEGMVRELTAANQQLGADNNMLVTRLLEEKEKIATEMNRMTQVCEALRSKVRGSERWRSGSWRSEQ